MGAVFGKNVIFLKAYLEHRIHANHLFGEKRVNRSNTEQNLLKNTKKIHSKFTPRNHHYLGWSAKHNYKI